MASMLALRVRTRLWTRRPELAEAMARQGRNPDYVSELALTPGLVVTASLAEALTGADVVVMAVPSQGFRAVLGQAVDWLESGAPVVSLTKGLEQGTSKRMTEIVAELAPGNPHGVLTGPNLVGEIVAGQPTAAVVAMADPSSGPDLELAAEIQALVSTDRYRAYTNADVIGSELAGALKNVVAIAAGMADGLGFGDNSRAALITRGLAELTRLGVALGGEALTFAGLAGMGDLVATCISPLSRNRFVGEQLGRGRTLEAVAGETRWVAEGVPTAPVVVQLARQSGVETPLCEQVDAVLHRSKPAAQVLDELMTRVMKPELHGLPQVAAGMVRDSRDGTL